MIGRCIDSCWQCGGTGRSDIEWDGRCLTCKGLGTVDMDEDDRLPIPEDVDDGPSVIGPWDEPEDGPPDEELSQPPKIG